MTKNWNWPKGLKLWLDGAKGFAVRGYNGDSTLSMPANQCLDFRHVTGEIDVPKK